MRKYFLFILMLLIASTLFAQFRGVEWGASKGDVKEVEGSAPIFEEDLYIVYQDTIGGLKANVFYQFYNDKLASAAYIFTEQHSQDNGYISDFKMVDDLLTEKYGEPESEKVNWEDDLYRDDPSRYGFAVSIGHLSYFTTWIDGDVEISNMLAGDNYTVNHAISYEFIPLMEKIEASEKSKDKNKL